jgi:voltage-dependent potassium channel beta subunit
MEYRKLGEAGLRVSEIALGAWLTFGAEVDLDVTRECIKAAVDHGVNYLDNADIYAKGEAERVMGQAIRDLGLNRQHLVLSSKVWWPMSDDVNDRGLSRKHVMESIEGSLRRMQTDYVDLYFCHRYDPYTPLEEIVRAMDDLIHQGKVLYWGTSTWSAAQIEALVGACRVYEAYRPRVEQPRYNMLNRQVEVEVLPTCAQHGIGVTAYSPLAEGVLTGKYNQGIPEDSRAARGEREIDDLTEENVAKVRELTDLAQDLGLEMAQLALAWVLRRPELSAVVTGATKVEHVLSNVQAAEAELAPDTLERIEDILDNDPTRG